MGADLAFSGLMLLYFTNIRRFVENLVGLYQNSISFLNLCAVALLLCTYTGRFMYPLLSLEGPSSGSSACCRCSASSCCGASSPFRDGGRIADRGGLVLVSD